MNRLWESDLGLSVRELRARLNGPWAYTTVMTTLDRLYKKGLATREPRGRAFAYRAGVTQADLGVRALKTAVSAIEAGTDNRDLAVAALVDAIESHDPSWLDSLDRLVREKKRALKEAGKPEIRR